MSRREREADALRLLGLARRAGGAVPGTAASRRTLRAGDAFLLLTAEDASDTQTKKVLGIARSRDVPHRVVADRSALGRALGTSPVSAVAVTIPTLAHKILEELPARHEGDGAGVGDTGGR